MLDIQLIETLVGKLSIDKTEAYSLDTVQNRYLKLVSHLLEMVISLQIVNDSFIEKVQ